MSLTSWQVRRARAAVKWYLKQHYGRPGDPGLPEMFFDKEKVGHFAISAEDFYAGDDDALFKLLVATVMFQRRQDVQIMRVLKNMAPETVNEITDPSLLLELADEDGCAALSGLDELKATCDLAKHPKTKVGVCQYNSAYACALKRHTVALKRYGHFGKVPTALAMALRERGFNALSELYQDAISRDGGPTAAAERIEEVLQSAWRVSDKIAAMYLSMLTNSALSPGHDAPWAEGVDATKFVVIDSNVDLFLKAIDYPGPWTYQRRREFIEAISERISLDEFDERLDAYNPRIVQQAMYLFMSESNRRSLARDCSMEPSPPCSDCDAAIKTICPRRVAST